MNVNELEKWLETEEGKQWLENKKMPLINKRNELLNEINDIKSQLTGATSKINDLEEKNNKLLEKNKLNYIENVLTNSQIKLMPSDSVKKFVISEVVKLSETDGGLIADYDDNGNFNYMTKSGKTFNDFFNEWTNTEEAKGFILNLSTGGGARGSGLNSSCTSIKNMSAEEVAKNLDNESFKQSFIS